MSMFRPSWLLVGLMTLALGCQRLPGKLQPRDGGRDSASSSTLSMADLAPRAASLGTKAPLERPDAGSAAKVGCESFLAAHDRSFPGPARWMSSKQRCFRFKHRFFALVADAWRVERCARFSVDDRSEVSVRWTLVEGRGEQAEVLGRAFHGGSAGPDARQFKDLQIEDIKRCADVSHSVDIVTVSDYDGDENPELVVTETELPFEAPPSTKLRIFTVKDHDVMEYPHSPLVSVVEGEDFAKRYVKDVDEDGRPDFLTQGPYSGLTRPVCGGIEDEPAVPPMFLSHARPDGTFSETDELAQTHLKQRCPLRPDLTSFPKSKGLAKASGYQPPYDGNLADIVVCGRAWGLSSRALLEALRPWCVDLPTGCPDPEKTKPKDCPEWFVRVAEVEPRVRLK